MRVLKISEQSFSEQFQEPCLSDIFDKLDTQDTIIDYTILNQERRDDNE